MWNGFRDELMKLGANAALGASRSDNPVAQPLPATTGSRPASLLAKDRKPTSYSVVHNVTAEPAVAAVAAPKMTSPPAVRV